MNLLNLLNEKSKEKMVIKTSNSEKVTFNGKTKRYPIYKISLECLYFNDCNDRIATYISQYKYENGYVPDMDHLKEYNQEIEKLIVESDKKNINKFKNDIKLYEQKRAGVVLNDGRIISGNRRFACLRQLSRESNQRLFFEAVILDKSYEKDKKAIKRLELNTQYVDDQKSVYDPIDCLVGVYRDLIAKDHIYTVEEYAKDTYQSKSQVKKRIEVAKLMIEFLDFINASFQFHIARDLKINGPLEELYKLLKYNLTEHESEILKKIVFINILFETKGDITRYIRKIKNIIGTEYQEAYFEEQIKISKEVLIKLNNLASSTNLDAKTIKIEVTKDREIRSELAKSLDEYLIIINMKKDKANQFLKRAIKSLMNVIDIDMIKNISDKDYKEFEKNFEELKILVNFIDEILINNHEI